VEGVVGGDVLGNPGKDFAHSRMTARAMEWWMGMRGTS
jgi:hypothetical protein